MSDDWSQQEVEIIVEDYLAMLALELRGQDYNKAGEDAVAQDSLKLSHEMTALYLSSFRDDGILTRLLMLPANVVKDAANLSIVSSTQRKKIEADLMNRMNEMDKRLAAIQAQAPKK